MSRRKPMSEINVVPYIDVMLVLLVIFMATAPLLTQGVQVDLPQAPSQSIDAEEPDPLVVSMRNDGALFLNIGLASRTKKEEDGTRVTIFSLSEQAGKVLRARGNVKTPLPLSICHHPIRAFESNELIVNHRPNLLNKWSRDHHGPNKKANR